MMHGHLSISSSEPSSATCYPWGAIWAVAIVVVTHLAATSIYPEPIARDALRKKFRSLVGNRQPSLVVLGDSRAKCGIAPAVLEREMHLPANSVINLAESACDPTAAITAWREFVPAFTSTSLTVLNISFFAVNDRASSIIGDEILWHTPVSCRMKLVPPTRVFASLFLNEKAVWSTLLSQILPAIERHDSDGFHAVPAHANMSRWTAFQRRQRAEALRKWWYDQPCIDGWRWQQFARDLADLAKRQPTLVVVLLPEHPEFLHHIASTSSGEANRQFRQCVIKLCEQLGVGCLIYDATSLDTSNPDLLFHDFVHFNQAGANKFSSILAADLIRLGFSPDL